MRLSVPLGIIKHWSFALFYAMAELWGSVVASLLFWSFASDMTSLSEAKAYFPIFSMMANVALVAAGQFIARISNLRSVLPPGVDGWSVSVRYFMTALIISCGGIIGLHRWIMKQAATHPGLFSFDTRKASQEKTNMGFWASIRYLSSMKYIRNIAIQVICYGMAINLTEVTWKTKLREAYPDPERYSQFMGNFSTVTGISTIALLFLSRHILQRYSWLTAAMIPPATILVTGVAFFGLLLATKRSFHNTLSACISAAFPAFHTKPRVPSTHQDPKGRTGLSLLKLAVLVGAVQNILCKACKYTLFDPCKEMTYKPLDYETRCKGKAAIDVIGTPLGKSGAAMLQQLFIMIFGSLLQATPYLGVFLFGVIHLWISAVKSLNAEYLQKLNHSV